MDLLKDTGFNDFEEYQLKQYCDSFGIITGRGKERLGILLGLIHPLFV